MQTTFRTAVCTSHESFGSTVIDVAANMQTNSRTAVVPDDSSGR